MELSIIQNIPAKKDAASMAIRTELEADMVWQLREFLWNRKYPVKEEYMLEIVRRTFIKTDISSTFDGAKVGLIIPFTTEEGKTIEYDCITTTQKLLSGFGHYFPGSPNAVYNSFWVFYNTITAQYPQESFRRKFIHSLRDSLDEQLLEVLKEEKENIIKPMRGIVDERSDIFSVAYESFPEKKYAALNSEFDKDIVRKLFYGRFLFLLAKQKGYQIDTKGKNEKQLMLFLADEGYKGIVHGERLFREEMNRSSLEAKKRESLHG